MGRPGRNLWGTLSAMITAPYDALEHARILYAENLRLRELLTLVAQDLERLACQRGDPEWQRPLLARAMRVRQRLHEL